MMSLFYFMIYCKTICSYSHFLFLGGPKNYAYETHGGKSVCKIRGFSLNFKNSKLLNFEVMRDLVESLDSTKTIAIQDARKISRDVKRRKVFNKQETKLYRLVYTKRVINDNGYTLPYGF